MNKVGGGIRMIALQSDANRMNRNAGVAIGPILFIIAILAILAAAIAAGSGSFTGNTNAEGNKVKASALLQIGETLRMGMDQITLSVGIAANNVNFDTGDTGDNLGLFSPTGGGIAPPSLAMANAPLTDLWHYVSGTGITGYGSSSSATTFAILSVPFGVCAEINSRLFGFVGVPTDSFAVNIATPAIGISAWPVAGATWITSVTAAGAPDGTTTTGTPTIAGSQTGCFYDADFTPTTGASTAFFFYQVLAIQ